MADALVPVLNKTCPFGYVLEPTTGLCSPHVSPWLAVGVSLGALAFGYGAARVVHTKQLQATENPEPSRTVPIVAAALGAGVLTALLTKSFSKNAAPATAIPIKVAEARRAQAARREFRKFTSATVSCKAGCVCVGAQSEWCAAGKELLRPNEVKSTVSFVPSSQAPKDYDFTADVAQWISFFHYAADAEGDTWCPPSMTLDAEAGDCEDLSLLVASVLMAGNVDASLMIGTVHDPNGDFGHAWVEGVDQHGDFLIESTSGMLYRDVRPSVYDPKLRVRQGVCTWL